MPRGRRAGVSHIVETIKKWLELNQCAEARESFLMRFTSRASRFDLLAPFQCPSPEWSAPQLEFQAGISDRTCVRSRVSKSAVLEDWWISLVKPPGQ